MTATPEQIAAALAFKDGARKVSFRFDRLDKDRAYQGPLESVLSGEVSNNAFADIKRTAKFTILDDGSVNYLSDMIQPYFCLSVPQPPAWIAGDIADRKNMCQNPRPITGSVVGWSPSSPTYGTDGWATTSSLASGTPYIFSAMADEAIAAGDTVTLSARLKSSTGAFGVATHLWARPHVRTGNTYIGPGVFLTMPTPGSIADVSVTFTAATAIAAGQLDLAVLASNGSSGVGPGVGLSFSMTEVLIDRWPTKRAFFDGNTPNSIGPGFDYVWMGTARNSPSQRFEHVSVSTPDEIVEWPLGVFQLTSPTRAYRDGNYIVRDVEAYDLLLTLRDDKTADRYVLGVGANYTTAVAQILQAQGFYQNVTPSSLTVPATMEWEPGTSYLRIVNDILGAINYDSVFFDETGVCICRPYQSPVDRPILYEYTADADSIIAGDIDQTLDLFGVPNKWVLVKSEPDQPSIKGTYTNTSISSPTSTVSRGRTIVDFSTEEEAANVGTLNALAKRKAFEASQVYEVVEFESALMPFHGNYSVIMLTIDDLAIGDRYSEHEWTLPLQAGELMSHKVRRVVAV